VTPSSEEKNDGSEYKRIALREIETGPDPRQENFQRASQMTHIPSAMTATAAVAASCLVASADAFAASSFAPATLRAAHTV
jgi:hypothetical protein